MQQDAYLRSGLKKFLGDAYDQPRMRAALDVVIARDLQTRLVNDFAGDSKHVRQVAAQAEQCIKDMPAALDQLARRHGYKEPEVLSEPGFGKRSALLTKAPFGHQGWTQDSKYGHLPDAPAIDPKIAEAGRSRYADLPPTPMKNGQIDYDRLNQMAGHGRAHPRWR
jgi:hypothetical protein